jgi:phosphatidate cytidylyltransferase
VLVGLIPAILGGWVFAIAFAGLAIIAFQELARLLSIRERECRVLGCAVIVLAALLASVTSDSRGLPALVSAALVLPLLLAVFSEDIPVLEAWPRTVAASLLLAVPTFAAVSIRQTEGTGAGWLRDITDLTFPGASQTGTGLGWLLLVLLTTWLSDTGAFLVGRRFGRRKLIPRISPNKTVEGALGGVAFAGITTLLCTTMFELDMAAWLAAMLGFVLGVAGILGDLAESAIKRHAGVKDSGTLIPGHGGMLDRIDALLFTLVTAWLLIPWLA